MTNSATPILANAPSPAQQELKKKLQHQLENDRALMMMLQPFTALLAMRLRIVTVVDDRMPTACTDYETLFFNAEFLAERSAEDRRFILSHEVWHCVLSHHLRRYTREPRQWNIACDYEVNNIIYSETGHRPKDALYKNTYCNLSAEQIYQQLDKVKTIKRQKTIDIHDAWAALKHNGTTIDSDFSPRQPTSTQQLKKDAEGWRQQIRMAAQQTKKAGKLPGNLGLIIDELTQPKISWQQVLQRFVIRHLPNGDRQWLPPSRRHIYRGLYLPTSRGSKLELAIAIDTSGSCLNEIDGFITELTGILGAFNQVTLDVIIFDAQVEQRIQLTENDLHRLYELPLKGGGGTEFTPIFEELKDTPPQCLIIFTDGYAAAPQQPTYPVLWALTKDGECPVNWGEQLLLN